MSMARTFTSMVSRVDVRCCEGAVDGVHFSRTLRMPHGRSEIFLLSVRGRGIVQFL